MSTLRHWLWLSTRGVGPQRYAARILDHFGSPEAAYHADGEEYDRIEGMTAKVRATLLDKDMSTVEDILEACQRQGIRIVTYQDAEYPERLRQTQDPPCVLYVRGQLPAFDEEAAIAIVGARNASPYGIMAARKLGLDLARQGALVVSGSARGIDSAAIEGALKGGGRVVAVLGNGVDVVYPRGSEDLYEDIAARGALVSEFPPGTEPLGANFPVRNHTLAGLCVGVVVVEGNSRSGSLITARCALDEDRDVFAVPGNYDAPLSRGPNRLIRDSQAKLILGAEDILCEYQDLYPAKLRPTGELPGEKEAARLGPVPEPGPAEEKDESSERDLARSSKTDPVRSPRTDPPKSPRRDPEPAPDAPPKVLVDLRKDPEAFTDDEAAILRALQGKDAEGLTADEIVEATGIPARRVLSALTMLQVRQMAGQSAGKRFTTPVLLVE